MIEGGGCRADLRMLLDWIPYADWLIKFSLAEYSLIDHPRSLSIIYLDFPNYNPINCNCFRASDHLFIF